MQVGRWLNASISSVLLTGAIDALAQTSPVAPAAGDPARIGDARGSDGDTVNLDTIVVTARLGTSRQRKVEASYSITTLDDTDLRTRAINSFADAVGTIPGIRADSSGGVGSNNVIVRGIPRGGYEALAVYEDGLPLQHDPGINWINVDQFIRFDETYAGIEAVRGGPSSIFAANAPGGLINLLPRKGTPELTGIAKLTTADYEQYRGDVWIGGPIADDWLFSIGGYYNKDDGIRDPGFTANEGGQGRVIVSKKFANGNLSFGVKYMEDDNFFQDAIPLTRRPDGTVVPIAPFNGHDDTLTGREIATVVIRTPRGTRRPEFDKFSQNSDLQLTIKGDVRFDDGTTVNAGVRYRDANTNRNARGLNALRTIDASLAGRRAAALAAYGPRGATGVRFVYASDGTPYPADANGNGLVGENTFQSIQNPIKELIALTEIGRVFETGIGRHDVKIGISGATADWSHDRNDGVGITEIRPNARLLDVIAVNAGGNFVGRVSENGIQRYNSRFANAEGGYEDAAIYISDEWQPVETLRLDAGFRYEKIWISGISERARTFDLGDPTTLADDNVIHGSGEFNRFDEAFDDQSYTAGINWQFMRNAGVFARYTNTYRLPQIGQYRDNVLPTNIRSQSIEQAEGGVKFQRPNAGLFATVFYNNFQDVQFTNTFIDQQTLAIVQEVNYGDVRTIGLELEAFVRPFPFIDISATATFQDPEFRNYTYNTLVAEQPVAVSFDGNRPGGMPRTLVSVRPGLTLFNDRLRVQGEWRYEGRKFGDDANINLLPAFSVFNASVQLDITPNVSVLVKGTNLSNSLGLGEGGGRQLLPGVQDANIFTARPIFGRTVSGSILFKL